LAISKKLPKANNHPMGENSPNLVTPIPNKWNAISGNKTRLDLHGAVVTDAESVSGKVLRRRRGFAFALSVDKLSGRHFVPHLGPRHKKTIAKSFGAKYRRTAVFCLVFVWFFVL
jgi:hypothetical protein